MVRVLFDTNILIDFLAGVRAAAEELGRHEESAISLVTWMEVLSGAAPDKAADSRRFLDRFRVLPIDRAVAEASVTTRRKTRLKLPDAIILATATTSGRLLVTRDKAFDLAGLSVRIVAW